MKKVLLYISAALLPVYAHAGGAYFTEIKFMINSIHDILNMLIALITAVAIVVFFWGLAMFIRTGAGSKDHTEGRNLMVWGVIALFVMASVYSIVNFIATETGVDSYDARPSVISVPG